MFTMGLHAGDFPQILGNSCLLFIVKIGGRSHWRLNGWVASDDFDLLL